MTKNFRLSLLGLGILAGLALLAELAIPMFTVSPDTLETSRARSEHLAQKKADAMVAEILQRPLFNPVRQQSQIRIARAEPPRLQGRLAGVMLQPDLREALFARPGGKPVSVTEGQVIDGWTVKKIEADQVYLTSPFGEQVVRPTNSAPGEVAGPQPMAKNILPAQSLGMPLAPSAPAQPGSLTQPNAPSAIPGVSGQAPMSPNKRLFGGMGAIPPGGSAGR